MPLATQVKVTDDELIVDLDEHIGIEGLLAGRHSGESQRSFEKWLAARKKKQIINSPYAAGIFLRGFHPWQAGFQSDRLTQRYLGKDREEAVEQRIESREK
jgi:hypothetical protein